MNNPYAFDEFFASDFEESISPFLTKTSREWGKNISLRSSLVSAFLLAIAFAISFINTPASYILLSLIYFLVGVPALIGAIEDLKTGEINIDVLMTLAAFVAILLGSSMEGALLLVLFSLSHSMEDSVSQKTRSAVHNLHTVSPKFASLIDSEGRFFEKSVRDIQIGDVVAVKHGEIVPLDGKIVKGSSFLNFVHLTGESLPVAVKTGDAVSSGARNLEGMLLVEVTRLSGDSTISRILQLITQAAEAKPRVQNLLDRFGKYYASSIIVCTFVFALLFPLIFSISYLGFEGSIYRALAFLIAASPCALIIATPTAYLSAISACAKKGILLKGGITLDALSRCKVVAFDKTGTLTTGDLRCIDFASLSESLLPLHYVLAIAYGLEQHVTHPIAKAIHQFAEQNKISPVDIAEFKAVSGSGLEGIFDTKRVAIGLPEYIFKKSPPHIQSIIRQWETKVSKKGKIASLLLIGEELFAFQFSDEVRKEAKNVTSQIKNELRLHPVMLTGDHLDNAETVGKELGFEAIFANLRPEEKLAKVEELSAQTSLAMIGDGINDAPALARATVGISMGKIGSAHAVDASDVVLLNDDIHLIPWLFSKSQKTQKIVQQNLTVAIGIICCISIPALFGLIPLWLAVLMHEGGTVLVGCNSLRLLK